MKHSTVFSTRGILSATVALFPFTATPAVAQTAPAQPSASAASDENREDIVVTATKREERLRDVAVSVTAISGADLDAKQFVGFADYTKLVPGLSIQQVSPSQNRVTLRGLNAGGGGSTVAIYVDDSPVGSSTTLAGGAVYTNNEHTWDLQRVEVLRGPQGTLYGANAQGGLIKFVSNQPNLDRFGSTLQAGLDLVDGGDVAPLIRGVVNVPLKEGVAALRVSGYYDGLPGFIDDRFAGKRDINSGYRRGFRVALLIKPTENLSINLTGFHQESSISGSTLVDVVGSATTYANPPANRFDPVGLPLGQGRFISEPATSRLTNLAANITWNLGPATLTSITSYQYSKNYDRTDFTSITFTVSPPTTPAAPQGTPVTYGTLLQGIYGQPAGAVVYDFVPLKKYTQELRLASAKSDRFEWQVGGFYTLEKARLYQPIDVFALSNNAILSPVAGETDLLSRYQEYAAFVSATYKFSPLFDIELGGRWARNKQHNDNFFSAGVFTGGPFTTVNDSSETAWTYSAAPRLHLGNDTLIYARVASGFRPGGPNNITTPAALPANFPREYRSDSTINYELGLRTKLFDNMLSVDVGAFLIDWTDIQLNTKFNGFTIRANGGTARSQGFEWAFRLRPVSGLTLDFTGSYVDAKLGTLDPTAASLLGAATGDQLPYVPKFSTALDANYRAVLSDGKALTLGATYAYTGARYTDFSPTTYTTPHTRLPGYSTLSVRAGLDLGSRRIEAFVQNATDERGITIYSNANAPGLSGYKGIIQPRTFGLRLTAKFD